MEKSSSPTEMKLDLMIFILLEENIHQPLHDSYGNDKGGNNINVSLLGKPTNLHSAWDGGIVNKETITTTKILSLYPKLSAAQQSSINSSNNAGWI